MILPTSRRHSATFRSVLRLILKCLDMSLLCSHWKQTYFPMALLVDNGFLFSVTKWIWINRPLWLLFCFYELKWCDSWTHYLTKSELSLFVLTYGCDIGILLLCSSLLAIADIIRDISSQSAHAGHAQSAQPMLRQPMFTTKYIWTKHLEMFILCHL